MGWMVPVVFMLFVAPQTEPLERVPSQREGRPFASLVLGITGGPFFPAAQPWQFPSGDGGFRTGPVGALSQISFYIAALHFFDHIDLYVEVPAYAFNRSLEGTQQLKSRTLMATGLKVFPWALRPGTLRPYLGTGLLFRGLALNTPGADDQSQTSAMFPLAVGIAWRTRVGLILDFQAEYLWGPPWQVGSGLRLGSIEQPGPDSPISQVNANGLRLTLGAKWVVDASAAIVSSGFREAEARRLRARIDNGSASTWTVGIGPSTRLFRVGSPYLDKTRPALGRDYGDGFFPHVTLGYYVYPWDLEVRAAWRGFGGGATAFDGDVQIHQQAVLFEGFKFFDVKLYGFVPFVGLGLGVSWMSLTEHITPGAVTNAHASRMTLSIPFGWDIRVAPSAPWVLRTNLRWIPVLPLPVANGVWHNAGGLEFDFIQFVLYPERLWK